jgi:hypothetical protein
MRMGLLASIMGGLFRVSLTDLNDLRPGDQSKPKMLTEAERVCVEFGLTWTI